MPSLHWTLGFWPLTLALHGIAAAATPAPTCAVYNAQSRTSAERLNRELLIANSPLRLADLQAGRNPKLAAYMAQFADDVQAHGLQGQGEPAGLASVRDHYSKVMSAASPPVPEPDSALREDVYVVAGPMAAHRYRAALHIPAFPPDFGYYDSAIPLNLRGQTIFDYSGANGTIHERWSNHDNKFRTGQVWRYMVQNPRDVDPHQFRRDLQPGDDGGGGRIDRDGDRLNAVFNGEQALLPGDFTLVNGAFTYRAPMPLAPAVTEMEGLRFVARWFANAQGPAGGFKDLNWLTSDARLHGAGCDEAQAAGAPSSVGGTVRDREAASTLLRLLQARLGAGFESELLQPVAADAPYGRLPVSGWSRVGFQSQLTQAVAGAGTSTAHTGPARYCAQWIMLLRNEGTPPARELKAQEVWLNLHQLEQPGGNCNEHFAREHAAAKGRECQANAAWCGAAK